MSSLAAFESCLSMPQPAGAGRPAVSCAWTRTACLSGRLSVSRGQSALPYLLLLSMPRHTSSLSSSHALSSTLRRKTLSRLLSASHISTQKGLSCPRYTRYPASQPIPITSGPIQFPPTNPEAASEHARLKSCHWRLRPILRQASPDRWPCGDAGLLYGEVQYSWSS
jgi:hypothetical protein